MGQTIPNHVKVAPFIVFYLIHSMQIGTGLLGFQRIITKQAGNDAWIMVIISGLLIHLSLALIYKTVETVNGDLVSVHTFIFGNIVGKTISTFFIVYFLLNAITVIRSYIEIVQVWMFPESRTTWFVFPLLLLIVYVINGGLKTVGGTAFMGAIIPIIIYITVLFTTEYANFQNLLPIMDHSFKEMMISGYRMSLSYIGFEALLIYYPFVNNPKKSKKWAHMGLLATTLLYTYFTLFTLAFFSRKQIEQSIWPTLTMWKVVEFPMIERFEYVGIATWLFMILPNICLGIWASSRIFKRTFPMKMRTGMYISVIICLLVTPLFKTTIQIEMLKTLTAQLGLGITFGYVPLLCILTLITKRVKNK